MARLTLYHMVASDQLAAVLKHGLRQGSRGSKSSDPLITQADQLLDEHCPPRLQAAGVSRQANQYAYIPTPDGRIIDIRDGEPKLPAELAGLTGHHLLRLEVDSGVCYVSDLDRFDAVVAALRRGKSQTVVERAQVYWRAFTPIEAYKGGIRRPEAVITTSIFSIVKV
jgi:hypothetical protein